MIATIQALEKSADGALGLEVQVVDFLSGYTVPGILAGFTPGEVTVTLPEMLTEQRAVTVHFHSFVFGGEILYCRPKGGRYEAHITIDDAEEGMRKAPRFPLRLAAQMFPADGDPVDIAIVDVSGDGLGIELPAPVEAGQPIAIASGSVFVFAIVRYCCCVREGAFRAGVEMQHLLERNSEGLSTEPRAGLLGKVFGRRVAAKRAPAW